MVQLNPPVQRGVVLLVDDSAFARRKARQLVEELGYDVIEAADGVEALRQCEASAPDLVMLDVVMAGMTGAEVLKQIRELIPTMPVIVATADAQEETAKQMRGLGAADVIAKPLSAARVAQAINRALSERTPQALSATHVDALAELINIGYGRAAAALSAMTRARILLEAPSVVVCPVENLRNTLSATFTQEVACVNQVFSGPITGNAMLLLESSAALTLSDLLDPQGKHTTLDPLSREAIAEVGNILLSACLGVFGNLLHVQVAFAIPHLHINAAGPLIESLAVESQHLRHTVLVRTRFTVASTEVSGYLAILLSVTSLERLFSALEQL